MFPLCCLIVVRDNYCLLSDAFQLYVLVVGWLAYITS